MTPVCKWCGRRIERVGQDCTTVGREGGHVFGRSCEPATTPASAPDLDALCDRLRDSRADNNAAGHLAGFAFDAITDLRARLAFYQPVRRR